MVSNLAVLSLFIEFLWFHRYESAEDCSDDDDDKLGLSQLRKNVLEELKMHDSLVKVRHFSRSHVPWLGQVFLSYLL